MSGRVRDRQESVWQGPEIKNLYLFGWVFPFTLFFATTHYVGSPFWKVLSIQGPSVQWLTLIVNLTWLRATLERRLSEGPLACLRGTIVIAFIDVGRVSLNMCSSLIWSLDYIRVEKASWALSIQTSPCLLLTVAIRQAASGSCCRDLSTKMD